MGWMLPAASSNHIQASTGFLSRHMMGIAHSLIVTTCEAGHIFLQPHLLSSVSVDGVQAAL